MNPNPRNTKSSLSFAPNVLLGCAAAGLLIGQVVSGIASHQPDAGLGLAMALVFLVSGAACVLSLAKHAHLRGRRARGTQVAPVRSWLLALGAGLLASLHATTLLAA